VRAVGLSALVIFLGDLNLIFDFLKELAVSIRIQLMQNRRPIFTTIPVGIPWWCTQSPLARRGLKTLRLSGVLTYLLMFTQVITAQEPAKFEKIGDISPDGKFGVRISCGSEPEDPENVDPDLITAVELVSLPAKKAVMNVGQPYVNAPQLIWSRDSKWFAYPFGSGSHVTDTYVYHRSGEEFTQLETDDLRVDVKGDVRNEYVRPVRWVRPGVLLLEQHSIFYGGSGDASYQFTAKFDDKTGKFQITSKKKIPSKE
jgi:hypothetical protein